MKFSRTALAGILTVAVTWAGAVRELPAQALGPANCGTATLLPGDTGGYIPLPAGELFCPLLADPKDPHSFASFLEGSGVLDTKIAAIGLGDSFGLFRIAGSLPTDGIQLSLVGGVFAQFDLNSSSYDLLNADYIIGLPLTIRYAGFSARARVYHQSSHLGDEFLLREPGQVERENLSFESFEVLVSQEIGAWRGYAGGEYLVNRDPEELEPRVVHAGAEFRQLGSLLRTRIGSARAVAALDVKASEEQDYTPALSLRGGFEIDRPQPLLLPGSRWFLMLEAYDGPAPYGQFYTDDIRYLGIGFHFSL